MLKVSKIAGKADTGVTDIAESSLYYMRGRRVNGPTTKIVVMPSRLHEAALKVLGTPVEIPLQTEVVLRHFIRETSMNLNVFNPRGFYSWRYPKYWGKNMGIFFRQFKWAYQRITKGYCDLDWYDLDTHLAQLMANAIDDLAEYGMGYPGTGEFDTPEKWRAYLKKIVLKLRYSLTELPNEYEEAWLATFHGDDLWCINEKHTPTPEGEEIRHKYLDKEVENGQKKFKAQLEALDMIKHVWGSLWD